jgi:CTP synthase (UTP-ammonia lyase)
MASINGNDSISPTVPHITNEIKELAQAGAQGAQVALVEIGGTV